MEGPRLRPERVADFVAEAIIERIHADPARLLVGLAGGPGAGKSTIAEGLVAKLETVGIVSAHVPMDGFHMSQAKLNALGLAEDKGMHHTFEAGAFVRFLGKLKTATTPVRGPIYSRDIEDVVEDGYVVDLDVSVAVVEGNYLLLDTPPWNTIRNLLDLSVYLDIPQTIVKARLLKRHAEHGRFSHDHIVRHVEMVDLINYDLVATTARNADIVISINTPT